MPGTLQSRIQLYTGTISDTTNMTDLINASIKSLINIIPESKIEKYASASADSGSGVDISSIRFIRAHKGGYRARLVDAGLKTQVLPSGALSAVAIVNGGSGYTLNDVLTLTTGGSSGTCKVTAVNAGVITNIEVLTVGSGYLLGVSATTVSPSGGSNCTIYVVPTNGSIHQATTTDPVCYLEATKAYVVPSGGTIIGMSYPSGIVHTSTTIPNFPAEWEQAVILDVVIQELLYKSNLAYDSLTALAIDSVSVPSAPGSASYTYTDAVLGTYTSTTIGALPTSPVYTAPTCSLTSAPSDLTITAAAPSTPSAPNYSYSDASLGTFTATTIGSLGTPPAYTKPTINMTTAPDALNLSSISIPSAPAEFALSLDAVAPTAPSAPSIIYSDAVLGTFDVTVIDAIPTAPVYTKPTNAVSFTNIASYIGTAQDLEKAQTEIQHQSVVLNSYNNDITNELSKFNSLMENQKLTVTRAIKQAEFEQEKFMTQGKAQTDLNIQNELQTTAALIANYQAVLGKYNGDLNRYQQIVNTEVTKYSTNLQRYVQQLDAVKITLDKAIQEYRTNLELWQTKRNTELAQYNTDIQNELNEFNKEVVIYQSTVQNAIRQAELDQERLMLSASKTTDLNIQNKAQALTSAMSLYKDTLQKYNEDLVLYQSKVNTEVTQYKTNLDKWTADRQTQLGLYSNDIQNATASFNKELAVYNTGVQKLITQAQLDQDRLMRSADKTTDLSVINKAKDLEKQIAQYQSNLQLYSDQVNVYGQNINQAVQKYTLGITKLQSQMQLIMNTIEQCRKEYQRIVSMI